MGLLKFTAEEESLFLLDEPDTHLNPKWSVEYLNFLKDFIGDSDEEQEASHVIMTTHNPLAIAELSRKQVQILQVHNNGDRRKIVSSFPETEPRGMGYASIVTSDMFGIASSLDRSTQLDLEKQRLFSTREKLTPKEQDELDELNTRLDLLGFRFFYPDDEYSRYLRLRSEELEKTYGTQDTEDLANSVLAMSLEERESLSRRIISALANDQQERPAN